MMTSQGMPRLCAYSYWSVRLGAVCRRGRGGQGAETMGSGNAESTHTSHHATSCCSWGTAAAATKNPPHAPHCRSQPTCGSISAEMPASHRLRAKAMRSLSRPPPPRAATSTSAWLSRGRPATAHEWRPVRQQQSELARPGIADTCRATDPAARRSPCTQQNPACCCAARISQLLLPPGGRPAGWRQRLEA